MRLSEELKVLLDCGLILRTAVQKNETPKYLPALPPEEVTIQRCCYLLDHGAVKVSDTAIMSKSAEILHDFDLAAKNCASDKKIFEL